MAQGVFYIDVEPSSEQIIFLEKIEKLSEKNIDNLDFFRNSEIPLLTDEEIELHLKLKRNNEDLKQSSYRIYFYSAETYDTLTIVGLSRNYKQQLYEENNLNKDIQLWLVPIIAYQRITTKKDYNKLSKMLHELFTNHFKSIEPTTDFNSLSLQISEESSSLASSFYLFTCPEVYIFKNPYDPQSEITGFGIHDFISPNHELTYHKFPLPKKIHFSIIVESKQDNSTSTTKPLKSISSNMYNSNLKFIIHCDNIGVTYTNSTQSKTQTFWAKKDYVYDYLKDFKVFQLSMDFYLMSALHNSFKYD